MFGDTWFVTEAVIVGPRSGSEQLTVQRTGREAPGRTPLHRDDAVLPPGGLPAPLLLGAGCLLPFPDVARLINHGNGVRSGVFPVDDLLYVTEDAVLVPAVLCQKLLQRSERHVASPGVARRNRVSAETADCCRTRVTRCLSVAGSLRVQGRVI